ncbi:MAG: hypothetical protein H5U07_03970 [Candidatus Aminicenantes bacterium]|nr:hypothetical protein [Candidatus Aminicenantes bacterium]
MSKNLVDLFRTTLDLEDFFTEVKKLQGNFSLSTADLMALGQAYFERYPEKFVQRNLDEVRLGYQLTRFCLLEKALSSFPEEVKEFFRQAFDKPEAAPVLLEAFRVSAFGDRLQEYFVQLQASLSEIKTTVDELPKGMIKERFLGGLSTLHNVVYLLKILISRNC